MEMILHVTSMLPRWVLIATSDSEDPKRTQRGTKEDPSRRIRGETVIHDRFFEVLSRLHKDSITFLDYLAAVGSRFVLSFQPGLYIRLNIDFNILARQKMKRLLVLDEIRVRR
jgi:hypothetical protein